MHWNYMRFPQGKAKALTFSFDDGVEQDEPLIALFEKYRVKGTFNLNAGMYPPEDYLFLPEEWHRRHKKSKATALYSRPCVEVASHAYTHAHIGELPMSVVTGEFIKDRESLERQFGRLVLGGCYPYGCMNEKVLLAAQAAGLEYVRGCECTYTFGLPESWLNWKPTCSHQYSGLSELTERFLQQEATREQLLFYLWGHSYEFTDQKSWGALEAFLEQTANRADVWYATNGEIYAYTTAYRRLQYSCDGSRVFNPSALPVWFAPDLQPTVINPGETVELPPYMAR